MEMNQENFDKLLAEAEKAKGLQNALHEARESNKELKSQLGELNSRFDEIEKNKATAKEQDLIKKGKLEQLIEQKNAQLQEYEATLAEKMKAMEEMQSTVSEFNQYKQAQEAKAKESLIKKMESLDENKRNLVLDVIKDKPIEKQSELVDQLLSLSSTPDYNVNPKGGDKPQTDPNREAYMKAKESGDVIGLLQNAKTL